MYLKKPWTLVVQVTGKVRANLEIDSSIIDNQDALESLARDTKAGERYLVNEDGQPKDTRKVIMIRNDRKNMILLNFCIIIVC